MKNLLKLTIVASVLASMSITHLALAQGKSAHPNGGGPPSFVSDLKKHPSQGTKGIDGAQQQAKQGMQKGMDGLQNSQASPQGKQKGAEGMQKAKQRFLQKTERAKQLQKSRHSKE